MKAIVFSLSFILAGCSEIPIISMSLDDHTEVYVVCRKEALQNNVEIEHFKVKCNGKRILGFNRKF